MKLFIGRKRNNTVCRDFDYIFSNPPFYKQKLGDCFAHLSFAYKTNKTEKCPPEKLRLKMKSSEAAEVLFIEHIMNNLVAEGKATILLPNGVLANSNLLWARKFLLDHFSLKASIQLPKETFMPHTGVITSVLVIEKSSIADQDSNIFMSIIENVGWDSRLRSTGKNDIPKVLLAYKMYIHDHSLLDKLTETLLNTFIDMGLGPREIAPLL